MKRCLKKLFLNKAFTIRKSKTVKKKNEERPLFLGQRPKLFSLFLFFHSLHKGESWIKQRDFQCFPFVVAVNKFHLFEMEEVRNPFIFYDILIEIFSHITNPSEIGRV